MKLYFIITKYILYNWALTSPPRQVEFPNNYNSRLTIIMTNDLVFTILQLVVNLVVVAKAERLGAVPARHP